MATTTITADTIVQGARVTTMYAEKCLEGIDPKAAAVRPKGINTNHPAWILGHLAVYPEFILKLIGREDIAINAEDYDKLFGYKSELQDDPDFKHYPAFAEITKRFFDRMNVVIDAVAEADESTFAKPMPKGEGPDMFSSVGATTNFLLGSHCMMHLGQLSAYRRIVGLGSCM